MQLAVTYVAQKYRKNHTLLCLLSRAFYIYRIVDNDKNYVRHKKEKYFAFV